MIYVSEHKLICVQKIEESKYSDRDKHAGKTENWGVTVRKRRRKETERERESGSVLQVRGLRRPAAQCVKITPPLRPLHNVSSHVCSSVIYNPD